MKTNFKLLATFALAAGVNCSAFCQTWDVTGNVVVPGQYLGSNNNQPINIFTNNLMRATFTTNGTFGSGTMQGDGLKIIDPSGGPGNLELWTSTSNL